MQLNTKEKQRCLAYIAKLRSEPHLLPFSQKLQWKFGFSDFELIANKKLDLQMIQKNLKSNKYPTTKQFYKDLRRFFESYTFYAFENDELWKIAKHTMKQIDDQEMLHHTPEYEVYVEKEKKQKNVPVAPVQVPEPIKKTATLSEKLQMVYLLRSHENNFPEIKRIGETYKIGKMQDAQYHIKLDGTNWIEMLTKRV